MTFQEWLEFGIAQKWCGKIVCTTHDMVPMSEVEQYDWTEGEDFCVYVVRFYESPEHFDAAEVIV